MLIFPMLYFLGLLHFHLPHISMLSQFASGKLTVPLALRHLTRNGNKRDDMVRFVIVYFRLPPVISFI